MKVINLFAGPGAGKSVLACELFVEMKKKDYNVELVTEYAKEMVYEKRDNMLADQLYILAKQNRRLKRLEETGVEWAVTDGPLPLGIIYGDDSKLLHELTWECFNKYENFNVVLERNATFEYQAGGRVQKTVEAAKTFDAKIERLLFNNTINGQYNLRHEVGWDDAAALLNAIIEEQNARLKFN